MRLCAHCVRGDLDLAPEVDADGLAIPVACIPPHPFTAFSLSRSGIFATDWTPRPRPSRLPADDFRLPTAIIHGPREMPVSILFVSAPVDHAPNSGLLLFWTYNPAPAQLVRHLLLLASSFANTLATRRVAMRDQFNDFLDSVPSGIVLFDRDGQNLMINQCFAKLLGCALGPRRAAELAVPMRSLWARSLRPGATTTLNWTTLRRKSAETG